MWETQNLIRVFKEIVELNEELFNSMEAMEKNLGNFKLMKGYFFSFNDTVQELKYRFWIVQKVCEADCFQDDIIKIKSND